MKNFVCGSYNLIYFLFISVFLFFFIFGFPTLIGSLTPILTMGILFYSFLNYKKYYLHFPKEFYYLFLFLLFDFLVCLIIPVVLDTFDFSIVKTKINFIVSILAVYVLAKYFASNVDLSVSDFFKILLIVFSIQIIMIILMLLSSDFSQLITSFTRSNEQGERVLELYSNARGLGVADSSVFGLAIVMGLFLFLSFFSYRNKFIDFKYFIFLVFLGGLASISAGRTAVLGLIFGFLYFALNFNNLRSFYTLISTFVCFTILIYLLIGIDGSLIQNETLSYFYLYSMEPILNYVNEGKLSSTSTDTLHNMYFSLTERQFIFGDGRYSNSDGSYYLSTDAGYMRFVLFYGAFFSLLLYGYFIYFVLKISFYLKKYSYFFLFLLVLSFLFHYKGEVVLFAVSYNKLIFLIIFYLYLKSMMFGSNYD
ncbi:hypothetical protein [Acinetobacter sp. NigerLNRRAM0016]